MVVRAQERRTPRARPHAPGVARRLAAVALAAVALVVAATPWAGGTPVLGASPVVIGRTTVRAPSNLNLYVGDVFRYQDPNPYACTSTSAMDMLNFIARRGTGGRQFRWHATLSATLRDQMLAWERTHDTLAGGDGSDPHGWRNALNYYGWGQGALRSGTRVYDDVAYDGYDAAMKSAVRALASTRKPVGIVAWRGGHAQMVTGYYGLRGNPFAKDAQGRYTDAFSVGGFYISDPLRSDSIRNLAVGYTTLRDTSNLKLRLQRYYETDSPYDDPYTPGTIAAKNEWYGKFVLLLPIR